LIIPSSPRDALARHQLPPMLAAWMRATRSIECLPVRDLNLQRASDREIFAAARRADVVVMTKDADFVELLEKHGAPPRVILVTCGNTSNARLRSLVQTAWPTIQEMLDRGEVLVELGDPIRSRTLTCAVLDVSRDWQGGGSPSIASSPIRNSEPRAPRDALRTKARNVRLDAVFIDRIWCRRRGSNPHGALTPRDFESRASASFTTPACLTEPRRVSRPSPSP
jgi:predicted nuclease of predicted toxin-antitoxin system